LSVASGWRVLCVVCVRSCLVVVVEKDIHLVIEEKENGNPHLLQQLSPLEMLPFFFSINWSGNVAHMESCRACRLETQLVIGTF